jgi:hypothetical protein
MSGSLSQAELLALYDRDEREQATFPGSRREEVGDCVLDVDLVEHTGTVVYSRLDERTADAAIREQVAYFQKLGIEFEWKAYAHDRPADLIQRLAEHGFVLDEPEAILVLDLEAGSEALTAGSNVRVKRVAQTNWSRLPRSAARSTAKITATTCGGCGSSSNMTRPTCPSIWRTWTIRPSPVA